MAVKRDTGTREEEGREENTEKRQHMNDVDHPYTETDGTNPSCSITLGSSGAEFFYINTKGLFAISDERRRMAIVGLRLLAYIT